ncbi:phosphate-starvation-inducible PsiE family protein [Synechococcus sp. RedBA-s]|uniref:phosphate-starvation-inducible PsiE family protein n=1 Tax=Synechococcus sp. RedBA-s TaxID=2823741 RepID=UPI0020CD8739|nr:phosphate-starvation-inducible PsiE family protein [Synechococcus sp. RedBA-s]MCP9800069.1 phosphate-starvation-inducible PsiE family protein [Synechococcus sp. RedBA-s]
MARFSGLFDDEAFLALVDRFERQLAKALSILLCVVLIAASTQLIVRVWQEFFNPSTGWLGNDLIKILGDVLTVLIALEVLQNVTAYLRHHVVQIELVLLTALTAVARKVIVLQPGAEDKPLLLAGLGITVLSLSAGYWLVRSSTLMEKASRRGRAKVFRDPDQ